MSKQRRRPAGLEIGQEVVRTPQTIFEDGARGKAIRRPMRGRVDYIHPRGRFHIVAFEVRGKTIKETFQGVEV
ncbi:hypothetical protein [Flavonifractor sp. An100]|uniref:hypothetical protein n=1 Tax=Flavonifractor sp. An100 TaxID=1965538 RepID=UPI000B3A8A07|nr:hypothetical protein [Flavonifractor sp. An100]OUQ78762.1 hypothetical protein B5E43_07490 [Flavonifractor sp. An100]